MGLFRFICQGRCLSSCFFPLCILSWCQLQAICGNFDFSEKKSWKDLFPLSAPQPLSPRLFLVNIVNLEEKLFQPEIIELLQALEELLIGHNTRLSVKTSLRIFLGHVVLQQVEVGGLGTTITGPESITDWSSSTLPGYCEENHVQ